MIITIDIHLSTGQVLKEEVNGSCAIVFDTLFRATAAFDDAEKFSEFYLTIIIDRGHNLLNLLPIVDEAEGNERVLELIDSNTATAVRV